MDTRCAYREEKQSIDTYDCPEESSVSVLSEKQENPDAINQLLWRGLDGDVEDIRRRWNGILDVLSNPYLQRTWIIQETSYGDMDRVEITLGLSGETVRYGKELWTMILVVYVISDALRERFERLSGDSQLSQDLRAAGSTHSMTRMVRDHRKRYDLATSSSMSYLLLRLLKGRDLFQSRAEQWVTEVEPTLALLRFTQASHPADKVFVPLGLVTPGRYAQLRPDYRARFETVYMRVIDCALDVQKDLSILDQCVTLSLDLPTWVPNWRKTDRSADQKTYRDFNERCIFKASGSLTLSTRIDFDLRELTLYGFILDSIPGESAVLLGSCGTNLSEDWASVQGSRCSKSGSPLLSREDFDRVYNADTFRYPRKYVQPRLARYLQGLDDISIYNLMFLDGTTMCAARRSQCPSHLKKDLAIVMERDKSVQSVSGQHQILHTTKGRWARCSTRARVGDLLVIAGGGNWPLILRQTKNESTTGANVEQFEFIGRAYVDGITDGEAVTELGADTHSYCREFVLV